MPKFPSINRYRFGKYGIPLFLVTYLFIATTRLLAGFSDEIFPFFAWTLFSHTPGWHKIERAVIVHSIDGAQIPDTPYLLQKRLKRTIRDCRQRPDSCNETVKQFLAPTVKRITRGNTVEFSIAMMRADLRKVQNDIQNLAEGTSRKIDYYGSPRIIGRWTIEGETVRGNLQFPHDRWNAITSLINETKPLVSSRFDLFLKDDMLLYVKSACKPADMEMPFYLNLTPANKGGLPERRTFDGLDFSFDEFWYKSTKKCLTAQPLPEYGIGSIETGQFVSGKGRVWSVELAVPKQ